MAIVGNTRSEGIVSIYTRKKKWENDVSFQRLDDEDPFVKLRAWLCLRYLFCYVRDLKLYSFYLNFILSRSYAFFHLKQPLLKRRQAKHVVGTYIKCLSQYTVRMKISGNDWRLTADGEYFFPLCRKRVRAMCDCDDSRSVYLSLRTLAIFLSSWPKRIPHFRVTNRGDVERWGRMRRRFEYIVQCTERSALLDHECFTTITPGRCWVCCCV